MRLEDERESSNVEDRRGARLGFSRGRSVGLWTIVFALIATYFGADPRVLLGLLEDLAPAVQQSVPSRAPASSKDETTVFVSKVLATTEDVWRTLFAELGQRYQEPKLVLFSGATQSACGLGQAAMGPFYCPPDHRVYIDLRFFDELRHRFAAPGDFAQAYVLAHEVGHHVQNLLGISGKIQASRQRVGALESNRLSVGLELQADCLAGVWAHRAQQWRNILEPGDIEEGLRAASAVGDDTLQRRSQGYVVPETFSHGTSEQRAGWFRQGFQSGTIQSCNTFGG